MGQLCSSADMRFILPLQPGEKAVLLADEGELASALGGDGIHVVFAGDPPWTTAARTVDHVLLPRPPADGVEAMVGEAARVLRPGAHLLLGVGNRHSIQRWAEGDVADEPSLSPGQARSWLQRRGFSLTAAYGVREGLCAPHLLISLAEAGPALFYFGERFIPYTWAGVLFRRLAIWLARRERHGLLFRDMLLVGQRSF